MDSSTAVVDYAAAQDLAEAMRAGLERRRVLGNLSTSLPFPNIVSTGTSISLANHADLLGFPPIARPGPARWPMRLARGLAKILVRPWLGVQTEFNRLAIESLHAAMHEIQRLRTRLDECDERIDNAYAAAVNRELGHDGHIARAGLWFNPAVSVEMHRDRPVLAAISERILEHMFVHTRLPAPPAHVLDLGCAESLNALELASFGYRVAGVDLRLLPVRHPNLTSVQADIGRLPFGDATFDVVVSLSTLEHVGLDWYTDAASLTTDRSALAEVHRVLRPSGRLILTVPFGEPAVTCLHRVYDEARLNELLGPWNRLETVFGIRDSDTWSVTTDTAAAQRMDSRERVSAVALVVAEKA